MKSSGTARPGTDRIRSPLPFPARASFCILTLLFGMAVPAGPAFSQGKDKKPPPPLVRTTVAVKREARRTQEFIGTLQPIHRALIGSPVDERVATLHVKEGDFVTAVEDGTDQEKATPLIDLDRSVVDLEYEAAKIELGLREQALEELELSIPVEIELAEARVLQAQAQRDYTQNVYQRLENLGDTASSRELEEAHSLYQTQAQALISAEAELNRLKSTRDIRTRIARQNIAAQAAEIRRISDLRERHTIRAPFSGYVTQILTEKGSWVARGAGVIELIQLDFVEMRVNVPQEYFSSLGETMADRSKMPEIPVLVNSLNANLSGTIVELIPQADERTRTVPLIIRIANPRNESGHSLVPGLIATATLSIGQPEPVVMVPKDAIVLGQGGSAVFVIRRDGEMLSAERVAVTTGSGDGELIAVNGQINEGDEVVVQGNEQLRTGQQVNLMKDDSRP
jgi:HlyD family secretion protein